MSADTPIKRTGKNQALFCCLACCHTENADLNVAKGLITPWLALTISRGTPHVESNKTHDPDPVRRTTRSQASQEVQGAASERAGTSLPSHSAKCAW